LNEEWVGHHARRPDYAKKKMSWAAPLPAWPLWCSWPICLKLAITGQHLNDFSPLADMANLTYLGFQDSAIADLTVISHMTNLTELDLVDNDQLQDISPLANLSALEKLDLRGSQVTDLVPLSQLPLLNWIYLADTPVNDFAPLVENSAQGFNPAKADCDPVS
jgi:hypothetical protein